MITPQSRNPNLDITGPISVRAGRSETAQDLIGSRSWWTGPAPGEEDCPGKNAAGYIEALPHIRLDSCSRAEVLAYFVNGWVLTELLFSALQTEEAFYIPPYHGLRHPLIFYYVHPAVLYINKLHVAGLLPQTLHPYYERLFETGVDEMSWDDLSKNQMEWPPLEDCHSYRKKCFELIRDLIETHPDLAPGHPPITAESPLWALFMGFEHERIHLETSSVLMRELPLVHLRRPSLFAPLHPSAEVWDENTQQAFEEPSPSTVRWVSCDEGIVRLGKDSHFPSFGWDNEYGSDERQVDSFAVSRHLISNGDFYLFVKQGGYREERWWSPEGWKWRQFRNVKWPTFWIPSGPQGAHEYVLRTLFDRVSMPWSWPVVVNFHEAQAYARWLTAQLKSQHPLRLLTEAEHHRIRQQWGAWQDYPQISEWEKFCRSEHIVSSLRWGSEAPVDRLGAENVSDIFGNVWQWLEDHFSPLPGFEVHPLYDDFSTPCFDGKHQMIIGGSFISAGDEASPQARFHFRPHFFQHAGFRVVDPLRSHNDGCVSLIQVTDAEREEQALERLSYRAWSSLARLQDLLVPSLDIQESTCELIPQILRKYLIPPVAKALDIGCGAGGMSYRLTACAETVLGVDLSAEALAVARQWQSAGFIPCPYDPDKTVRLDDKRLMHLSWRQCDAASLPAELMDFDLIVAGRILSQLPSPKSLLARMGGARGLVKVGGIVVLADSYEFDGKKTPKSLWLKADKNHLEDYLGPSFQIVEERFSLHIERVGPQRIQVERVHLSFWRRLK